MAESDQQQGTVGGRGRGAVAASILAVVLIGAYFAAPAGREEAFPVEYLVNAAVLALAFWFPAQRLGSPRDLRTQWRSLIVWILAWTLVWDLATAGVMGGRALFQEWWLVYPSGVIVLTALLALHALVVARTEAGTTRAR